MNTLLKKNKIEKVLRSANAWAAVWWICRVRQCPIQHLLQNKAGGYLHYIIFSRDLAHAFTLALRAEHGLSEALGHPLSMIRAQARRSDLWWLAH